MSRVWGLRWPLALVAAWLGLGSYAAEPATTEKPPYRIAGLVEVTGDNGQVITRPLRLEISNDWKTVRLLLPEGGIRAAGVEWKRGEKSVLALAFTSLPEDYTERTIVLRGTYDRENGFRGLIWSRSFTAAWTAEDRNKALRALLDDPTNAGFEAKGRFVFSSKLATRNRSVARRRGSDVQPGATSNNPCPNGPCWTTGGVGRYKEYYAGGPIQNPGGPSVAASFNRGVPYAWTRQGQLEAQRVGIARANSINRHIEAFARPYWGWGFFWGGWR